MEKYYEQLNAKCKEVAKEVIKDNSILSDNMLKREEKEFLLSDWNAFLIGLISDQSVKVSCMCCTIEASVILESSFIILITVSLAYTANIKEFYFLCHQLHTSQRTIIIRSRLQKITYIIKIPSD